MAHPQFGPFKSKQFTADSTIVAKPAVLAGYTIQNKSGAAVDVTFYDDAANGSSNPIESITVGANTSQAVYPQIGTENGLGIKCSLWTSVTASVRFTAK